MRIAIFICNYSLGASTAIINTCLFFAEQGIHVDVFSYNNVLEEQDIFRNDHVHLHILTGLASSEISGSGVPGEGLKGAVQKIIATTAGRVVRKLHLRGRASREDTFNLLPDSVLERSGDIIEWNTYTAFIGVEPAGLLWAELLGGGDRIPLIYWSLELYLESDQRFSGTYHEMLRRRAKTAHRKAMVTIIQDEERARLLAKQDNVPLSKFIFIPVAVKGEPVTEKSTFLYDILNIPRHKKIIISVGLINELRLSLETACIAPDLPKDWVMVLHGLCFEKPLKQRLEALQNCNFIVSTNLVPHDQLVSMIASAHIGLSLYRAAGDNERLTGAASSKTAQYLQCGLPVIANDFESIRKVVQQYGYGICIDSPSRIPEALDHIIMNYDEMRQNAFRCYREKYEITPYLRRIVDMFEGLEAARSV